MKTQKNHSRASSCALGMVRCRPTIVVAIASIDSGGRHKAGPIAIAIAIVVPDAVVAIAVPVVVSWVEVPIIIPIPCAAISNSIRVAIVDAYVVVPIVVPVLSCPLQHVSPEVMPL